MFENIQGTTFQLSLSARTSTTEARKQPFLSWKPQCLKLKRRPLRIVKRYFRTETFHLSYDQKTQGPLETRKQLFSELETSEKPEILREKISFHKKYISRKKSPKAENLKRIPFKIAKRFFRTVNFKKLKSVPLFEIKILERMSHSAEKPKGGTLWCR